MHLFFLGKFIAFHFPNIAKINKKNIIIFLNVYILFLLILYLVLG